jgi:flagellar biosynthesis/type III secretory pathway chaperone
MTTNATTTLEALVREQATILLDLSTLSERQQEAVVRRDTDALDEVLDQRQVLINKLSEVAGSLAERSAELQSLSTAGDGRVSRDLAEVSRLWSQLASRDSEDLADLRTQRDELARELAEIGKTERAKGAYGASKAGPGGAIFQDTQA